jgi:predicted CxxxxCH...CXXCH cytochrome family protein
MRYHPSVGGYGRKLGASILVFLAGCLGEHASPQSSCASCHGTGADPAPPEALGGETSTDARGVGAHQAHLGTTSFATITCEQCHDVPSSLDAPGHVDSAWPAEVRLVKLDGTLDPTGFDAADTLTCTTWCHGAKLTGGALTTPLWTKVDGTQDACGTCHGNPPPGTAEKPHPARTDCGTCHSADVPDGVSVHVDGVLNLSIDGDTDADTGIEATCASSCHGDDTSPAPPADTSGNTDTTARGVGAHRSHLAGGIGAPVACSACHVVPESFDDGHADASPAEIVFGGVAVAEGADPVWDGATCSDSYCHSGKGGGSVPSPTWTTVDGTQAACGSCHSLPPPSPHPTSTACEGCHAPVAGAGMTIADPSRHVNGVVDR